MKANMGKLDRSVRTLLALTFTALYFTNIISGTLGLVLIIVSAIFLFTSFISFCPLYALFGIRTCPLKN